MPRETIQAKSNFQLSTIRNLKTSILEEANTQERYTKVLKRAASSRSTFRESSPLLVARQPLDRVLEENGRRAQVGRPLYTTANRHVGRCSTHGWDESSRIRRVWNGKNRGTHLCGDPTSHHTDANKRRRAVCGSADTLLDRMAKGDPDHHPPFPTLAPPRSDIYRLPR